MSLKIDWDATGSMLAGIGTIGGVVAVVIAAIIARSTVQQFRNQKITERLIEHAERILVATYKAQYALDYVRGRMLWAGELENAERILRAAGAIKGDPDERQKRMISAQVYMDRLSKSGEDQKLLVEVLPVARALWGKELEGHIQKLHHQFWLVQCFSSELVENDDRDRAVTLRTLLNGVCNDSADEISLEVRRITVAIEEQCLPVLKANSPNMETVKEVLTQAAKIGAMQFGFLPFGILDRRLPTMLLQRILK